MATDPVMDGQPILIGRDLRKEFIVKGRPSVQALQGLSFEIPRGVLAALVGPDGAGKTTLIRLAAGLLSPSSGSLAVLASTPATIRRRFRTGSATCHNALASTKI